MRGCSKALAQASSVAALRRSFFPDSCEDFAEDGSGLGAFEAKARSGFQCQSDGRAFLFSSRKLAKDRLFMWTFTFKELLGVKDTRKRWNRLLTAMKRTWPELQGIRVFEMHKRHGLHVHMVTNERIDVVQARALAEKAGWGRIHVTVMPAEHARYLAKYLSKERPLCLKRWRLWAAFGEGWEPTKVKDLIKESLFSTVYRACKEWQGWTGKGHFLERLDFARRMVFMTIEQGWKAGLGSSEKPYWMCCEEELCFGEVAFSGTVSAPF
jgi:hypothetical protein